MKKVYHLVNGTNRRNFKYSRNTPTQQIFKNIALYLLTGGSISLLALFLFKTLYIDRVEKYYVESSKPFYCDLLYPGLSNLNISLDTLKSKALPNHINKINTFMTSSIEKLEKTTEFINDSIESWKNNANFHDIDSDSISIINKDSNFDLDDALLAMSNGDPLPIPLVKSCLTEDEVSKIEALNHELTTSDENLYDNQFKMYNTSFGDDLDTPEMDMDEVSNNNLDNNSTTSKTNNNINESLNSAELINQISSLHIEDFHNVPLNGFKLLDDSATKFNKYLTFNIYSSPLLYSIYGNSLGNNESIFNNSNKSNNLLTENLNSSIDVGSNENEKENDITDLSKISYEWLQSVENLKMELRSLKGLILSGKVLRSRLLKPF